MLVMRVRMRMAVPRAVLVHMLVPNGIAPNGIACVASDVAAAAMTAALADAEIGVDGIDYVNAHGTSTPLNDRAETLAIKSALGEHAHHIPISSTKSATGHLLGAAGAIEAVATLLTLRDRVVAPTLGLHTPDEELDLDFVPDVSRPLEVLGDRPAVGVSNSFGFGGHNAVLVLEAA